MNFSFPAIRFHTVSRNKKNFFIKFKSLLQIVARSVHFLTDARKAAEEGTLVGARGVPPQPELHAEQVREEYLHNLVDFLQQTLCFDVTKRITAAEALKHPYLAPVARHHAPLDESGRAAYTTDDGDAAMSASTPTGRGGSGMADAAQFSTPTGGMAGSINRTMEGQPSANRVRRSGSGAAGGYRP